MSGTIPPGPGNQPQPAPPPADNSLTDAKKFSLDLGKTAASKWWDDYVKKDKPFTKSLEDAFSAGLEDCAKDAVKGLQNDPDPMSPHRTIMQLWGKDYYSTFGADIVDQLTSKSRRDYSQILGYDLYGKNAKDANDTTFSSQSDGKTDGTADPKKKKGLDWSIGVPTPGVQLKGAWTDLATKGIRPETIKQISAGESVELKYTLDAVQIKAKLKGSGTLGLAGINNWRDITYKDLQDQGSATAGGDLTLGVNPSKAADWLTRKLGPRDPLGGAANPAKTDAPSQDRVHLELSGGFSWLSTAGTPRTDAFEAHGMFTVTLGWEPDYAQRSKWLKEHDK